VGRGGRGLGLKAGWGQGLHVPAEGTPVPGTPRCNACLPTGPLDQAPPLGGCARLKAAAGNKTIEGLQALGCARRVVLTGTPVQNNLEVPGGGEVVWRF
jgi:hypothetical protein